MVWCKDSHYRVPQNELGIRNLIAPLFVHRFWHLDARIADFLFQIRILNIGSQNLVNEWRCVYIWGLNTKPGLIKLLALRMLLLAVVEHDDDDGDDAPALRQAVRMLNHVAKVDLSTLQVCSRV